MVLRRFFESEAVESLAAMRDAAEAEPVSFDRLIEIARVLRGSALLAGDARVHSVASAVAGTLAAGRGENGEPLRAWIEATIQDLEVLIAGSEAEGELDARARANEIRWGGARAPVPAAVVTSRSEAHGFAAREAAAIARTMEDAVTAFQADPHDRAWLGAVLRSQRALLGSVHLESLPVVRECLHAVEDLTALITRLDVPVKAEWLDIFRSARDVLHTAAAALAAGQVPAAVPALSRLRTLRDELLTRYSNRDLEFSGAPTMLEHPEA